MSVSWSQTQGGGMLFWTWGWGTPETDPEKWESSMLVFNSSLHPLLETMSEPNIVYWNYCKEMNCWAGCWPGACTHTAACQVGALGHCIWGRPLQTWSSQAEHLGKQSGRLQVFTCSQSGKWLFTVENIWRVAELLSQVQIVLTCSVWVSCRCCLTVLRVVRASEM